MPALTVSAVNVKKFGDYANELNLRNWKHYKSLINKFRKGEISRKEFCSGWSKYQSKAAQYEESKWY